ncbi:MAG: carbonic anhydrase family protein [Bdellovibrionota bacterium]
MQITTVPYSYPSEHTLNGDSYDAEVHFVHEATEWQSEKDITKKKLLVLGFLLKATDSLKDEKQQQVRALIQKVGDLNLRTKTGSIEVGHEVKAIPVTTLETYQYPGSLTTPPCSNNVEWHIAQSHVEITNQELEKLRHSIGLNNNRKISKRTTIIKG